ncbi:hypothetical protein [Candidatus Stoquefichus sp. SB1]|nr:hypothetical protein [Candidatus Stoquefichus sp. SB1]
MEWYKNMNDQQKKDFNKVVNVFLIGIAVVLLIPIVLHFIF